MSHKIRCAKNGFQALNLVKIAKASPGGLTAPPEPPAEFRKTQPFCKTVVDKSAWEYPCYDKIQKAWKTLICMAIQTGYEGANKLTNTKMLASRQNISQCHNCYPKSKKQQICTNQESQSSMIH